MSSPCPFCHLNVPLAELEWHANNHLEEEELARDIELAHQIALAPPSPTNVDKTMKFAKTFDGFPMLAAECGTSRFNFNSRNYNERLDRDNISCLVNLQNRCSFHKVEGGLMMLLRRCLYMENYNLESVITDHVDHFQSIESEDSGWGCGWRNIQMLCSHLMMERQEAKEVMFGGSGFVPDIPSLQRWLEIAWERGFDGPGAKSFNKRVYGSKKWIGATECATLLRSFGLRARIVDLDSEKIGSSQSLGQRVRLVDEVKRKSKQVSGPMDKFLLHSDMNGKGRLATHISANFYTKHTSDGPDNDNCLRRAKGPRILVDWVWNYFCSGVSGKSTHQVTVSEKMPLYFQHSGHSRTIVGIQMKKGVQGMPDVYNLLVLDPGQSTAALERSLREKNGWQQLIKRGLHTLKKPQYQLCYVDPGIAHGAEMEDLKILDSVLIKI
uniref:Zinc finger with UFM1-specific peptidase domain protein n=1 Tax=Anthurium amnicola TaxID=1678845 RepID=A0A1D1YG17_9ARAE